MNCKRVPFSEAKRLSAQYGLNQVIVVAWDKANNRTHIVTYGKSLTDCEQAAAGGNFVKNALGWPDELCHSEPARMRRKRAESPAKAHNTPSGEIRAKYSEYGVGIL